MAYVGFTALWSPGPNNEEEQTKWNHQICVMIPAQVRFQQLEKSWKEPKGHVVGVFNRQSQIYSKINLATFLWWYSG